MYDLLNQSCNIFKNPSTLDAFGKRTWGASDTVDCRFVRLSKLHKSNQGNDMDIVCKFQIADRSVNIGTKIEFETKFYVVKSVQDWRDQDEVFGCLVYCSDSPYA